MSHATDPSTAAVASTGRHPLDSATGFGLRTERGRALVWVACVGILSASRKIVARSCAQLSRVRSHTIPSLRFPVATHEAVPAQRAHTSVRPRGPQLPSLARIASLPANRRVTRDDGAVRSTCPCQIEMLFGIIDGNWFS